MATHGISRQYCTTAAHDDFTCMALSSLLVIFRITIARRMATTLPNHTTTQPYTHGTETNRYGNRHMATHGISRQYCTTAAHDDFTCMALSSLLVIFRITIARRMATTLPNHTTTQPYTHGTETNRYGNRHMATHGISRQYCTIAAYDDFTCMTLSTLLVIFRVTIARRMATTLPNHTTTPAIHTWSGIGHTTATEHHETHTHVVVGATLCSILRHMPASILIETGARGFDADSSRQVGLGGDLGQQQKSHIALFTKQASRRTAVTTHVCRGVRPWHTHRTTRQRLELRPRG